MHVATYGLENVLFPVGTSFIEIVAPTRPGTAAGRFLERHGGRYGYMVILDCDDPAKWQARAETLGVRVTNVIRHGEYFGVQLHPRDTGAAILEFNSTVGGRDPMGPYAPAGPDWQAAIRDQIASRLLSVEIECPDPGRLAGRWGDLLQKPVEEKNAGFRILLEGGAIDFLPGSAPEAVLAGVVLETSNPAAAQAREAARISAINVRGVRFDLRAAVC